MPPPLSSSSLSTFMRRVVQTVSHNAKLHPTSAARLNYLVSSLQKATLQTFPSLSAPAHALRLQPTPLHFHSITKSFAHPLKRLGNASAFSHTRPRPSGGLHFASNVGLGTARTFASGPAAGGAGQAIGKVPIGLRAFANLLSDEEHDKALPRASRYTPYQRSRPARTRRTRARACRKQEYQHYFPLLTATSTSDPTLPPLPETLVTPDVETTLSLPLSPSLNHLLSPTTTLAYDVSEIGLSIFARLLHGILPLHDAFSIYGSTRLIPLLAKMEGLGVLTPDGVDMQVILDSFGQPDILRIVFSDRSKDDVKRLLGESLRAGDEGDWWHLHEEKLVVEHRSAEAKLTVGEEKELKEDWISPPPISPRVEAFTNDSPVVATAMAQSHDISASADDFYVATDDLIIPTLDMSIALSSVESWPSPQWSASSGSSSPDPDIEIVDESLSASLASLLTDMEPETAWEMNSSVGWEADGRTWLD
ncbi:hypothetical protein P7C73_g5610, partial [Tremellales sp. Uapishka_1]